MGEEFAQTTAGRLEMGMEDLVNSLSSVCN